jgi:leucyl-tRNA synthetase
MGWDAFGLPAENAAIERGVNPADWTESNIAQMRSQLKRLGLSIDWAREVTTCRADYYRWTQWLFLQFLEADLAYQKEATVNWDPIDQTVLANEQVDGEGRSWRSGAQVEKRLLRQWFLKITAYADALLDDLSSLEGWPERVRTMQANWIGRSTGAELQFEILDPSGQPSGEHITVFTTRPDTVYGATYLVLAPEHPLVARLTVPEQATPVTAFLDLVSRQSERERTANDKPKRGLPIGAFVRNPANGERIPLWIADYVLADYGTGAVMGVPAHDQRDFLFARQHELPIRHVIVPEGADEHAFEGSAWTEHGVLIHSGPFDGLPSLEAKGAITAAAEAQGWGRSRVQYRLRDWLISRQRYWGCPIPVIHCPSCGVVPVPEDQLPVELPRDVAFQGRGGSALAQLESWKAVACPRCGQEAHRESDTMDTFMCSSWYFLRFADPANANVPSAARRWMDGCRWISTWGASSTPSSISSIPAFSPKFCGTGACWVSMNPSPASSPRAWCRGSPFAIPTTVAMWLPAEVKDRDDPRDPATGERLETFYEKMSKSKHNGIDPGTVIDRYGADTARMFILFKAPPEKDLEWDDADVEGQFRFLQRIWRLVDAALERDLRLDSPPAMAPSECSSSERELRRAVHAAIAAVSDDILDEIQFNTAIAELMKLSNAMVTHLPGCGDAVSVEALRTLLLLLAPFAPHLAEELWQKLGANPRGDRSIHKEGWPHVDATALERDTIPVVIQVKGKVRGQLEVPSDSDAATLERLALASEIARKWLEGQPPRRVIVVPGKLVNLVP